MARCLFYLCLLAFAPTLVGCRVHRQVHDPEYAQVARAIRTAAYASGRGAETTGPVVAELEGPLAVEQYIQVALRENPEIHAARKKMEALAHQVPVAASLQDPMLNTTVQPEPVQTAAGQQELIVAASQKLPWIGKLAAQASVAEAQTNEARAQLAAAELSVIAQVKRAYYELYFLQQAIAVTEADQGLLAEIRDVAVIRYESGDTSQQDVLRADLEISNVENDLIRLRQQRESVQAKLARLLHVSPQTNVAALDALPDAQIPQSLERLQAQAVEARPELHELLASVQRDQQALELARLQYKPDLTLGASWIDVAENGISPVANGRDAVLLSAGVNLPIYRKRLDSAVRSAEAKVVSTARRYDSVRDGTLEEVADLFAQVRSRQELLVLFREDILPKASQTLEVSNQAYNVGEIDFLQLLDNWRQLLRYEISYRRLEADLRQSLAELERVVGGYFEPSPEAVATPPAEPQLLQPDDLGPDAAGQPPQ